ncbi:hypothetical protein BBP40_005583 [Aspergillus hancockii]|nr:hypothetical protein BBP40_005583 [Aspergillus hancockii]
MEVATFHGIEAVQPGLEPVPNQTPRYVAVPAPAEEFAPREQRICGLRKSTFWLAVTVAALTVVVIAVAVGLGVGLSSRSHSTSTVPSAPPAATSSGTESTLSSSLSLSSSSTRTTSIPSGTSVPSPTSTKPFSKSSNYTCPGANNTEVRNVTGGSGSSSYYIFCDADISSSGKKDLASGVQSSFADCLALCNSMNYFQKRTDVGCTYNYAGTGEQDKGTCWCLGGENKLIITNPGNMVAVLTAENVVLQL